MRWDLPCLWMPQILYLYHMICHLLIWICPVTLQRFLQQKKVGLGDRAWRNCERQVRNVLLKEGRGWENCQMLFMIWESLISLIVCWCWCKCTSSFEAFSSPLSLSLTLGFQLNHLEWPVCPLCIIDTEVKHEIKHSRLLFPSDFIGFLALAFEVETSFIIIFFRVWFYNRSYCQLYFAML